MELADKSLLLDMLRMPRLGLSPDQVLKIERIIDGKPVQEPTKQPWVPYKEAMERLGLKTRQGVACWIRDGILDAYVPKGRKYAIGVTRASLEKVLEQRAG